MRAYERLLQYVRVHTASAEDAPDLPSTRRQFDLANMLVEELKALGVKDARVDEHCYVYASLPATKGCEAAPALGFIAHMDTIPDFSGENVKPQVIENYDGKAVKLGTSGRVLDPKNFPNLRELVGRTLITTDGTTILGADDKAGVAEIMTLVEQLQGSAAPHGRIAIGFTPDEEVGMGASKFDLAAFGADYAYTVDGEAEGEIVYENFNACDAVVETKGFNVHPGSAKDTMINAQLVAMEFNDMLPKGDTPRDTEGYEGFFHLCTMEGVVEHAKLHYIVRDHSAAAFDCRKACMEHITKLLNAKYGAGTVTLTLREQYRNMAELIRPVFHLVDNAVAAIKSAGLTPKVEPIRGGTDGAQLTYKGLPCPNLGTGSFACHGPYEHATAEGMDACVAVLMGLCAIYAAKQK